MGAKGTKQERSRRHHPGSSSRLLAAMDHVAAATATAEDLSEAVRQDRRLGRDRPGTQVRQAENRVPGRDKAPMRTMYPTWRLWALSLIGVLIVVAYSYALVIEF
jgi:hypothetical protein